MEDFLKQLLPESGAGRVAALCAVVLAYLYPHLRSSWRDLRHRHAAFDQAKRQLELLKLCCEIEGLRKDHQLTDAKFTIPPPLLELAGHSKPRPQPAFVSTPRLTAAWIGAVGCFSSFVLRFGVAFASSPPEAPTEIAPTFFLGVLVVCLVAAAVASALPYRTRPYSFIIGALFPWTLWGIVALISNYGGEVSSIERNA